MIPSPFAPVQHGKQLSLSQIERMGQALQSACGNTGMGNLQYETGGTGQRLIDQTPRRLIAIITGEGGSGSGGSGSGTPISANDQYNAYSAVEGVWTVTNDDFEVVPKRNGVTFSLDSLPLIEANGVEDVPVGAVVEAIPAVALGYAFYWFLWTGEISGSGSGGGVTVQCSDGSRTTYQKVNGVWVEQ